MESLTHLRAPAVEYRRHVRNRALIGAKIVFNNANSTADCRIRNISHNGAKLEIAGFMTLPLEFELWLPQRGTKRSVRVVWQRGLEIGVTYAEIRA